MRRLESVCLRLAGLLCAFAFACAGSALANSHDDTLITVCPGNDGAPLPATLAEKSALATRLAALAATCRNDPGYLAWHGALLSALGRPADAALLLEHALLLNPDHAAARIDYAEALAALGDRAAARTLFDEILHRPDLPEHLGDPFRRRLLDLTPASWQFTASLAARLGHESNLNSAPARSNLDLTLPDGKASFELADSYRAQAGGALLYELSAQATHALGTAEDGPRLNLAGEFKTRSAPQQQATDFAQTDLMVQLSYPSSILGNGVWLLDGGLSVFHYAGARLHQAWRSGFAHHWPAAGCLWRLGIEAEARRYPVNGELDSQFRALAGGTRCLFGSYAASIALRHGSDRPKNIERPGATQQRDDWRATLAHPLATGVIQGELQLSRQNDASGYSPLLADNAVRRIDRLALRLEYAYPLDRHWEALATIETSSQRSNIALFDIDNRALWFGLRWNGR